MGEALKVLFVDDEQSILDAFRRQLRNKFELRLACGGADALNQLAASQDFAVVISDMRMPGMDGVEFLRQVQHTSPNTVRLMLTGNSDQETAAHAVNQANIFRFLTKPCSSEDLAKALTDALSQHRLIVAEKELLEQTLSGSVKLLTDTLALIDPQAFGQALKLREEAKKLARAMGESSTWEVELAAMLLNIGYVTVPSHITNKLKKGYPLTPNERELITKTPEVGANLIKNIPRLEEVARIVRFQNRNYEEAPASSKLALQEQIPVGARILRVLRDLGDLETAGRTRAEALEQLHERERYYDPAILALLSKGAPLGGGRLRDGASKPIEIKPQQLFLGQTLLSDVETKDGVLLISKGNVVDETVLERLRNYAAMVGLKSPILVDKLMPVNA